MRGTEYNKFQRQRQRKRKVEEEMFSPGEGESEDSPNSKLTCMDKLAMALTKKLEQDTRPQQSLSNTQPTFFCLGHALKLQQVLSTVDPNN